MTLDPHPTPDQVRAMASRRGVALPAERNGVALGPDSPLRSERRSTQAVERAAKKTESDHRRTEHDEQVALFRWADANAAARPELAKLFAIPNGGYRHVKTAGRLKAEGVKPGIPDVMLLVARGQHHGLMIEMKRHGGTLSPAQADWHYVFTKDGFRVVLATTWEMARDHVLDYLSLTSA